MNKDLLEYYRIVNPSPKDDFFELKESAINHVVFEILTEHNLDLLIEYIQGALVGYTYNSDSLAITNSIHFLQNSQDNYPKDFSDSALELKILSSLAIGEILSKFLNNEEVFNKEDIFGLTVDSISDESDETGDETEDPEAADATEEYDEEDEDITDEDEEDEEDDITDENEEDEYEYDLIKNIAFFLSVNFISGARLQATKQPHYLTKLNEKLTELANETIEREAKIQKETEEKSEKFKDRYSILSDFHSDFSETLDMPISSLNVFDAALFCSKELADSGVDVPNLEKQRWLSEAVTKKRKKSQLNEKTLNKILDSFTEISLAPFSKLPPQVIEIINKFPVIFPISWICSKLSKWENIDNLKKEFERVTCLNLAKTYSPETIGKQVFFETVSLSLFIEKTGE